VARRIKMRIHCGNSSGHKAEGRRQLGDVEVEPRVFRMEVFSIRRNFTERARRLISRNAGIAARVFDPTASAPAVIYYRPSWH